MDGARNTKSLDKPVYTRENLREMVAFCVEEAIRKLKNGEISFEIMIIRKDTPKTIMKS